MEEKKKEEKKLTYEQLTAYTQQVIAKAEQLQKENIALRKALEERVSANNYKEIELAFKCLDHKDVFPEDFIQKVTGRLVEILDPSEKTKEDKEET